MSFKVNTTVVANNTVVLWDRITYTANTVANSCSIPAGGGGNKIYYATMLAGALAIYRI